MAKRSNGQMRPMTPSPTAAVPPTPDSELRAAWEQRVRQRRFGDGITGVCTVRVFGRSGDEAVYVPVVESRAVLDQDPVARWAVEEAERIMRAKQQRGAQVHVLAAPPDVTGFPEGRVLGLDEPLDPTQEVTYLVLSRVIGG